MMSLPCYLNARGAGVRFTSMMPSYQFGIRSSVVWAPQLHILFRERPRCPGPPGTDPETMTHGSTMRIRQVLSAPRAR